MLATEGQPAASSVPPWAVSTANRTRSTPVRPGQPFTACCHCNGMPEQPHRAPSSAPAIAATVSVSLPARTAASRASCRCWAGKLFSAGLNSGTGV